MSKFSGHKHSVQQHFIQYNATILYGGNMEHGALGSVLSGRRLIGTVRVRTRLDHIMRPQCWTIDSIV